MGSLNCIELLHHLHVGQRSGGIQSEHMGVPLEAGYLHTEFDHGLHLCVMMNYCQNLPSFILVLVD